MQPVRESTTSPHTSTPLITFKETRNRLFDALATKASSNESLEHIAYEIGARMLMLENLPSETETNWRIFLEKRLRVMNNWYGNIYSTNSNLSECTAYSDNLPLISLNSEQFHIYQNQELSVVNKDYSYYLSMNSHTDSAEEQDSSLPKISTILDSKPWIFISDNGPMCLQQSTSKGAYIFSEIVENEADLELKEIVSISKFDKECHIEVVAYNYGKCLILYSQKNSSNPMFVSYNLETRLLSPFLECPYPLVTEDAFRPQICHSNDTLFLYYSSLRTDLMVKPSFMSLAIISLSYKGGNQEG